MARLGFSHARAVDPARDDGWPEELRAELRQAHEEADALRTERRALAGHVAELEKELAKAKVRIRDLTGRVSTLQRQKPRNGGTPRAGDEWLAGAADRTSNALKSGQEVAQQIVDRARQRAAEIERAAAQHAAEVRQRADADAHRALQVAQFDADGLLQAAQASAEEILAEAHGARDDAVAEFTERQRAMQAEIARLEAQRRQLLEACAALRRPIDEAIRTLEQAAPAAPAPRKRAAGRAS